ncbi:MAG: hypothetical protein IH931_03475 [candidate division Zixibacteria bacterium]|nr:hypothetical protein [candidate division Zixibacteria bacterium]
MKKFLKGEFTGSSELSSPNSVDAGCLGVVRDISGTIGSTGASGIFDATGVGGTAGSGKSMAPTGSQGVGSVAMGFCLRVKWLLSRS